MTPTCLTEETLVDWLAEGTSHETEQHLFECESCTARAQRLLELVEGLRAVVASGGVQMTVTPRLLQSLARQGLAVQRFVLAPEAVTPCSARHDAGLIVLELPVTLSGEVGLSMLGPDGSVLFHAEDLAFTPGASSLLLSAPATAWAGVPEVEITFRLHTSTGPRDFIMAHRAGV